MKIIRSKREKSTSTKGHYVTNAVLLPAVIEAKGKGVVTDKLIKMIWLIAERYSRKHNFVNYSFREDMVAAAVMNLCNNALKFNPEKSSNPFSFYTTAIHNSFLQYMADEKKHRSIRDALLIDAGANPSFNFGEGEKDESHFEIQESDEYEIAVEIKPEEEKQEKQEEKEDDSTEVVHKEAKFRYKDRIPGPVAKLSAGDFVLDPVTNTYVRKPTEPIVVEEKKVEKKKASAKKASAKKAPAKKAPAKKTVVKKAPAKKVPAKKAPPVKVPKNPDPKKAPKKESPPKKVAPKKKAAPKKK